MDGADGEASQAAARLSLSDEGSEPRAGAQAPRIAPSGPIAAPLPRGAAGLNARTRQLASTKLPPSLQAKLEAVRGC